MHFFKTPNVTVQLGDVQALSRSGSALHIHTYARSGVLIEPAPGLGETDEWELETYTRQWQELLEEQHAQRKAEHAKYMQGCLDSPENTNSLVDDPED